MYAQRMNPAASISLAKPGFLWTPWFIGSTEVISAHGKNIALPSYPFFFNGARAALTRF
jgi:hypothetical protein